MGSPLESDGGFLINVFIVQKKKLKLKWRTFFKRGWQNLRIWKSKTWSWYYRQTELLCCYLIQMDFSTPIKNIFSIVFSALLIQILLSDKIFIFFHVLTRIWQNNTLTFREAVQLEFYPKLSLNFHQNILFCLWEKAQIFYWIYFKLECFLYFKKRTQTFNITFFQKVNNKHLFIFRPFSLKCLFEHRNSPSPLPYLK